MLLLAVKKQLGQDTASVFLSPMDESSTLDRGCSITLDLDDAESSSNT